MELEDLIPQWKLAMLAEGRRARGITRYVNEVRAFQRWCGPTSTVASVTTEQITRYTESMAARGCVGATVKSALSALRSFSRWCITKGYLQVDPTLSIAWPKRRRGRPRPLKATEVRQLLTALKMPDDLPPDYAWMWQRNTLAVLIMLYAGLRISEVAALKWRDIDFEDATLTVIDGKNGKDRTIPMHSALVEALTAWNPGRPNRTVICRRDGKPIGFKSASHIFERWLPARGITFQSHRLRHTFGTQLLRAGANLREVQELMGHEKPETTAIYTEVLVEHLRSAVERLPETTDW